LILLLSSRFNKSVIKLVFRINSAFGSVPGSVPIFLP